MAHTRAAVLAYPAPEILRIEHSQANPLKLSLAWDPASEMPASLTLRAEIHPSRSVASNAVPLAAVTLVVTDDDTQPWTLEFSSQQTNLDLGGRDQKTFVLTITGIESSTRLYTLADADLVLLRHPCSQLVPAAVSPLLYATTEDLDDLEARVTDIEENGGGGGGGGGATDAQLRDRSTHTGTQAIATVVNLQTSLDGKAATSHTHSIADVSGLQTALNGKAEALALGGVTLSGTSTPTLAVSGTTSVSGTNTGNVSLAAEISSIMTLTGQVIGAVTDPGADRIVFFDQSANAGAGAWGYLTAGTGLNITGTTITATIAGTGSEIQFRDLATGALAAVPGTSVSGSTIILGAGDNLGTGAAERLRLRNTTPAVSGTNQNSPAIAFEGSAWQTSASASQAVETRAYIIPQAGSSIAAGRLVFEFRLNGGAWTEIAAFRAGFGTSGLFLGTGSAANVTTSNSSFGVYTSTNQFTFSTSTTGGHFVGPFSVRSGANDATWNADAAHQMAQRSGTNAQTFRVYDTFASATDFHRVGIATARATLSGLSGASVTATALIPAGAVVVGVTAKVLTAVTGATSWQLGTAADPDRFAAAGGTALGSTTDNTNWTAGGIECFLAATNIVLTANGSNFTGGSVYISVQYIRGEAD